MRNGRNERCEVKLEDNEVIYILMLSSTERMKAKTTATGQRTTIGLADLFQVPGLRFASQVMLFMLVKCHKVLKT